MNSILLAKTAAQLSSTKRRVEELEVKLAAYEKREEAEKILVEMMHDASVPPHLRPSSPDEFLDTRAQIEGQDLGTVKLALKMAGNVDFGIGEPEETTPLYESADSKADAIFTDWLLSSEN